VDFEILDEQIGSVQGKYRGPANGMEVEGVPSLIERWKSDPVTNSK
jgi:hypothetical protein